jgi:large subunit ribosomal protein L30
MTSLLVVNLHGLINTPAEARTTLIELGIGKRFAATVVVDDPSTMGALRLCKEYVAWSKVDADFLAALLKAKGRVSSSKTLDDESLKSMGYKDHAALASKMIKEGSTLSSIEGIKPYIGLSPPRGGFKRSSRRQFRQGGILGENPSLPDIVRRMM